MNGLPTTLSSCALLAFRVKADQLVWVRAEKLDFGGQEDLCRAGTRPSRVRPEAIAVLKELGIDISGHCSKHVDKFQGQSFDYVLTVCDNAKESCPVFPGHAKRIHNAFEDPAALQGTEEERLALFRRVRNEIRDYLKTFPANAG